MLKSTYKPSPAQAQAAQGPLPAGWTEHKAPTGQLYYYHAETKESTYKRPGINQPTFNGPANQQFPPVQLSDPRVANAYMAQHNPPPQSRMGGFSGGRGGGRGGGGAGHHQQRSRPQPVDKPRSKVAIPGCEPWILVYTKYGGRFAFHPEKNASFWRIPDKLKAGIMELDQARIREKAEEGKESQIQEKGESAAKPTEKQKTQTDKQQPEAPVDKGYDSSEYEEVEVTDDEDAQGDDDDDPENPSKRQRTDGGSPSADPDQPVEFSEADIAFQLQAMGGGADDDDWQEGRDGDYENDGNDGNYDNADDENANFPAPLSEEDARELFKDLLVDYKINPFSPWDKLLEEGKLIDDPRYTALSTTRERKAVWEEWSREGMRLAREARANKEEKQQDPRIAYLAFLHEKATPKLYWPEFRRKYRKEEPMRNASMHDRDREKLYREHISRLKMPQAKLRGDLTALLREVPPSKLHNQTSPDALPEQVLADVRYISLDGKARTELVEAYISGLANPPADLQAAEENEAGVKAREDRRRRERALEERERAVAEEKRRQQKRLEHSKAVLREEERELEQAMRVGKKGLHGHLMEMTPSTSRS